MYFRVKAKDNIGGSHELEKRNLGEYTLESALVEEDPKPLRINFKHEEDASELMITIEDEQSGRVWRGSASNLVRDLMQKIEERRTNGQALHEARKLLRVGQDIIDQAAKGKDMQPALSDFYRRIDEIEAYIGEPTSYQETMPDIDSVMNDLKETAKKLS
jgi:hypothetical protein